MRTTLSLLSAAALLTLASCNAPYGNGLQPMTPRADVESVERQAPVSPAPSAGLDGASAVQYGLDNRFGPFHGFGRRGFF